MGGLPSEEIKSRLDIHDVIAGYIRLQKQGANWRALCPFHNEKTPSFYVSATRQMWHCFGCGEGGDMFTFVMKMEGLEFPDALRLLAKKAGVVLKAQDPKLASERATLLAICAQAARFFRTNLEEGESGAAARAYLLSRGLSRATIGEFGLGYAHAGWDSLFQFLAMKGYAAGMVEKAGLINKSEKSGTAKYYDKFRDRIMFPIADHNGDTIAFTGRYLTPREGEGKYVNSPQTLLYNKSAVLYGMDKVKMEAKKKDVIVLVEGQMDVIMAWQDGVKNAVAVSGTAFTTQQLKLIARYTKNITILFDADPAGDSATRKSIALAHAGGFSVRVARMPESKDPADLVAARPGELAGVVDGAVSVMDFYFQIAAERHDPKMLAGKKAIGDLLLPQIKKIANKIESHHWLERLSVMLGVKMDYLEEEMRVVKDDDERAFAGDEQQGNNKDIRAEKTAVDKLLEHIIAVCSAVPNKEEAKALAASLAHYEFPAMIVDGTPTARELVSPGMAELFTFFYRHGTIDPLSKEISKDGLEQGTAALREILLAAELGSYENPAHEIIFCARRIEQEMLDAELQKLEAALAAAEAERDPVLSEHLFQEVHALSAKKMKLFAPSPQPAA